MCRLYGFRSAILSGVHRSLVEAENALAVQSVRHPDGWGVAYYTQQFPQVLRSEKQALEDGLFREVSAVVSTRTLLAHIRQATAGKISVLNCHPFQHGPWVFAHNGMIAGFGEDPEVQRQIFTRVDPRFRRFVLGQTDSELCFYIFLSQLARRVEDIYHQAVDVAPVVDSLRATHEQILELAPEAGYEEPNRLTFIATNGSTMVGSRFRRPLFLSTYKSRCPERDTCPAFEGHRCETEVTQGRVKHLILSSECTSQDPQVWAELNDGDWAGVNYGMHFSRGRL